MQIASRYAIAVHILALLGTFEDEAQTSEHMAGSIGVNPVIVRNVTGMLRRAGLVATRQGVAGTVCARPLATVTMLDVYRAVAAPSDDTTLFAMHTQPNPACPVGAHIQTTLEHVFGDAQQALEARLAQTTLADVVHQLQAAQ